MLAQQNLILLLVWQNLPEHQAAGAPHARGSVCSFHSTRIAGSSAAVASDTGDVTL